MKTAQRAGSKRGRWTMTCLFSFFNLKKQGAVCMWLRAVDCVEKHDQLIIFINYYYGLYAFFPWKQNFFLTKLVLQRLKELNSHFCTGLEAMAGIKLILPISFYNKKSLIVAHCSPAKNYISQFPLLLVVAMQPDSGWWEMRTDMCNLFITTLKGKECALFPQIPFPLSLSEA